jgi:hypothetical protein
LSSASFNLFLKAEGEFSMSNCAYPLSYTRDTSKKEGGIFHALGKKVRERFSRTPKPVDHLGGLSPEERLPSRVDRVCFNHPLYNEDKDLEILPKTGSTHEYMEVHIG